VALYLIQLQQECWTDGFKHVCVADFVRAKPAQTYSDPAVTHYFAGLHYNRYFITFNDSKFFFTPVRVTLTINVTVEVVNDMAQLLSSCVPRRLRSASSLWLNIRRTRLSTVADWAYPVAAARIGTVCLTVSRPQPLCLFQGRLKAFLFKYSFP